MSSIDDRSEQVFPTLTPPQIETARRFAGGEPQRFEPCAAITSAARDTPSRAAISSARKPDSRRYALSC